MTHYSVTMDSHTKYNTVSKSIPFFLGIIGLTVLAIQQGFSNILVSTIIVITIFILISTYIALYAFAPTEYILTGTEFIIRRPAGLVRMLVSDIESINLVESANFLNSLYSPIRKSGFFGYTGSMKIKNIRTNLYIKRVNNIILISTFQNGNILVSPDDIILAIELGEAIINNHSRPK